MNIGGKVLLTIVVLNALFVTMICGGSYAHLDPEEIYDIAYTVVRGTVIDVRVSGIEGFSYIYAEIRVDKYIKNPQEPPTICIIAFKMKPREGVNDTGAPLVDFEEGEKVVVFLEKTSESCYSLVGGFQGKFAFEDGSYVNSLGETMYKPPPYPQPYLWAVLILSGMGATIMMFVYWKKKGSPFKMFVPT